MKEKLNVPVNQSMLLPSSITHTKKGEPDQLFQGCLKTVIGHNKLFIAQNTRFPHMLHLINHQTQHRSEIAMQLTILNHSPGELGMSFFFNR